MTQMALGLDRNGNATYAIGKFPGNLIVLQVGIEQTLTVPSFVSAGTGKPITQVLINHSKAVDLFYKNHPTDAISLVTGVINDQTQNPSLRFVKPGQTLRFLSLIDSVVTLEWQTGESTAHK